MNPLLDPATAKGRAAEVRRTAEAARVARSTRRRSDPAPGTRHPVRHALGGSLLKAGLRLLNA